jgi:hypothetical protein
VAEKHGGDRDGPQTVEFGSISEMAVPHPSHSSSTAPL